MLKKVFTLVIAVFVLISSISACGGASGSFEPRPISKADLEGRTFVFGFVFNGAPFHSDLGDTRTSLAFGRFDQTDSCSFILSTEKGVVAGVGTLKSDSLTLTVEAEEEQLPFHVGDEIALIIVANKHDGRINISNPVNGFETTSEPD